MSKSNKALQFALKYADLGIPVFPLNPGAKTPATGRGYYDATTDAEQIRKWWGENPKLNVAIYPHGGGFAVIDVDVKKGAQGPAQLEALEMKHGELPYTLHAVTPSGGIHYLFRCDKPLTNHKIAPDIDIRCANGYIAVEPTVLADGTTYYWNDWEVDDEPEIAQLPDWVVELSEQAAERSASPQPNETVDLKFEQPTDLIGLGARFNEFLTNAPKAKRRWEGSKEGLLIDDSGSAMDISMGAMLKQAGFTYSEMIVLMATWPYGSSDPQRNTERYWRRIWNNTLAQAPVEGVEINLTQQNEIKIKVAEPPKEVDAPADLLTPPGIVGVFSEWAEKNARRPQPQFSVQAAIAFACTVLGRRYVTDQRNWPSLYLLNIGKSASGKEHAKWAIENALDACGLGHLIGPASYTSDSGLLSSLYHQPSHITVIDEFGKVLEDASVKNGSRAASTMRALMEVWGRCDGTLRPQGYSTFGMSKRDIEELQQRTIRNPALTLLAMTTPESFFDTVGAAAARDGFLNRFLIVESEIGRQPSRSIVPSPVPEDIVEWAARVRDKDKLADPDTNPNLEPTPEIIQINSEAVYLFDQYELECLDLMNKYERDGMAEMLGRTREMAMRLALVIALGCDAREVGTEHAAWAINYTRYYAIKTVERLKSSVGDSEFESTAKRVYDVILRAGERGATLRDITRGCAPFRKLPKRDRDEVLATLESTGDIKFGEKTYQSGQKRSAWFAIDVSDE